MPLWASGLASGLSRMARIGSPKALSAPSASASHPATNSGVIDHTVTIESGLKVHNALRVVPNGDGCEVMFTLLKLPGMTDEQFAADAAHVQKDLSTLKSLMER